MNLRQSEGMEDALPQLRPPERLLCGPGPTNVDPAVLEAMTRPMLGHLDPKMHEILLDVVGLLRRVYRMPDGLVLPLHCTGTAGMEAGIANLVTDKTKAIFVESPGSLTFEVQDLPAATGPTRNPPGIYFRLVRPVVRTIGGDKFGDGRRGETGVYHRIRSLSLDVGRNPIHPSL